MSDPIDTNQDPDEDVAAARPQPATFEVFNPDNTIGVACDRNGSVVGLHIDDEALDNGETWIADQILRLARLAHQKSRAGLRTEMERKGTDAFTLRSIGLPTQTEYDTMESAELGSM